MEILKSLGIDFTLWIHLACFLIAYFGFTTLVLKPYMAALRERERRTLGNEEMAVRLVDEANELHSEYERRARALNSELKGAFDQSRSEAMREYDTMVNVARDEAAKLIAASRVEIAAEIQNTRKILMAEIPAVSAAITTKLAGKEIAL